MADAPNPVVAVVPPNPLGALDPKPVLAVLLPPNPVELFDEPKRALPPVLAAAPKPVDVFCAVEPKPPPPKPPVVGCVLVLPLPNKLGVVDVPAAGAPKVDVPPKAGLAAPKPVLAVFEPKPLEDISGEVREGAVVKVQRKQNFVIQIFFENVR